MSSSQKRQTSPPSTLSAISAKQQQYTRRADDRAWIDVITQMDNIYAELVHHQVVLEEKNAELENAQLFIQNVISSITDVLIVCDINSLILQVNTALETITGIKSNNLTGQSLTTLFNGQEQAIISSLPDQVRSGTVIDIEVNLLNTDGEPVPMAIICSPLHDHKNRLSGFVITGRPLGELRKAYSELHHAHETLKNTQQQLIQSEKMASLGRLVAGVAHELNNPISFLYANMHVLQGYEKKFQTYLSAVHNNMNISDRESLRSELNIDGMMKDIAPLVTGSLEGAERISDIVKNLRRFATPQQQNIKNFDLIQIIKRATSWVLSASTLEIEIETDYPKQFELLNNEGHVHQILINLIQNAIDAMAESPVPRLKINVRKTKKQIKIIIHDNGDGIDEKNMAWIFDPFFTTKPVGSGTGLGLYISYGLAVEQCNGELTAHNHKDGGAVFTLSLPRGSING